MFNFPFVLDDFQKDACNFINEGKSVVVCAPTGAGKTVIESLRNAQTSTFRGIANTYDAAKEGGFSGAVEHVASHLLLHPNAHDMAVILYIEPHQHANDIKTEQNQAIYYQQAELLVRNQVIHHGA